MKIPTVPNEQRAVQLAEEWADALDRAFAVANIDHRHPAAEPLIAMSNDLAHWEIAARRGWHDARSFTAAARCLHWLQELEGMQRTANRRQRSVTRALTR